MTNGGPRGARLDIIERPSTTIVRHFQTAVAVAGATTLSPGVGPAVGFRWLIQAVSVQVNFSAVPGLNNRGVGSGEIRNGGFPFFATGVETQENLQVSVIRRGRGFALVMEFGDIFHSLADARASAVNVAVDALIWGVEYTVIGP